MKTRYLLVAVMAAILTACNSANTRQPSRQLVVSAENLYQVFPDKQRRLRFLQISMGPYGEVYRECVYYHAANADDGRMTVNDLVADARRQCEPYLRKVVRWLVALNKRTRHVEMTSSYMVLVGKLVVTLANNKAKRSISLRRNGEPAPEPQDPVQVEKRALSAYASGKI